MKSRVLVALGAACLVACATMGHPSPALGPVHFERVAIWRDDARGAYSIIHDDLCDDVVEGVYANALPALRRRGLRVGLAAIAGTCERTGRWREVEEGAAQGHEIAAHSYSHPRITAEMAEREIASIRPVIARHAKQPVDFFVFPYDVFTPDTVAAVEKAGYRGARAGSRDGLNGRNRPPLNSAEPGGDFAVVFDVWPRGYSKYSLYQGLDLLNVHVWDAIDRRGWAMRELHDVIRDGVTPNPESFGPVPLSIYEAHLDFLAAAGRANLLWTDTPSAILRYRHARTACKAAVDGTRIVFDASAPECAQFTTPISVVVSTRVDLPGLAATQKGASVSVLRLKPGEWSVTADPTRGDVVLSARSAPGRVVDAAAVVSPRPRPAASVCDVEMLPGRRGTYMLDDFTRAGTGFDPTELPSWSWYPPLASILRVAEEGDVFARFSGRALGAWGGATFAFGGHDGSGLCYDASGHSGFRFRLRGHVDSPDELSGKVIVSVMTAATRPQTFGGDLAGEGGHFFLIVPVTPEWRMVEIPWTALSPPSWGVTTDLKEPALKKLQAFDWGVTNTATAFDVDLDDVAFY